MYRSANSTPSWASGRERFTDTSSLISSNAIQRWRLGNLVDLHEWDTSNEMPAIRCRMGILNRKYLTLACVGISLFLIISARGCVFDREINSRGLRGVGLSISVI